MKIEAHRPQARLIQEILNYIGNDCAVIETGQQEWASATFTGMRHFIRIAIFGQDSTARLDRAARGIDEHIFTITGYILADIMITERHKTIESKVMPTCNGKNNRNERTIKANKANKANKKNTATAWIIDVEALLLEDS